MIVTNPIDTTTFTSYNSPLKSLYKRGQLPQVKYDFYGSKLNADNVTLDHLKCVLRHGKTNLDNLVLATRLNNQKRGSKRLKDVINFEAMGKYFEQFKNIKINDFDGNDYIARAMGTISKLLKGE